MSRVSDIRPVQGGASLMVAWRLSGKTVLVVGGGKVAEGRVLRALESDARVIVVAEILAASLRHRWTKGEITWRPSTWHPDDLDGVDMVLSCIDDPDVSAQIAAESRARGIPVNCADIPDDCDFWFTSVHRRSGPDLGVVQRPGPARCGPASCSAAQGVRDRRHLPSAAKGIRAVTRPPLRRPAAWPATTGARYRGILAGS